MFERILVYGWFGRGNVGDELFCKAYEKLFPLYNFVYVDRITLELLNGATGVFFGGGSFLYAQPVIDADALDTLKRKPIVYLGVGLETDIHVDHIELMKVAEFVFTRSPECLSKARMLNKNSFVMLDLAFALQSGKTQPKKIPNSVLVLPNIEVVPNYESPHWKHRAWEFFKSEFAQFLDTLVKQQNVTLRFFPMCKNNVLNDEYAAIEIVNMMTKRDTSYFLPSEPNDLESLEELFASYEFIITQRYHGVILAEMANTPYVAIYHHDKIKNVSPCHGSVLPFYGSSKQSLVDTFNNRKPLVTTDESSFVSFKELVSKVTNALVSYEHA